MAGSKERTNFHSGRENTDSPQKHRVGSTVGKSKKSKLKDSACEWLNVYNGISFVQMDLTNDHKIYCLHTKNELSLLLVLLNPSLTERKKLS